MPKCQELEIVGNILFNQEFNTLFFYAGNYNGKHTVVASCNFNDYCNFIGILIHYGLLKEGSTVVNGNCLTVVQLYKEYQKFSNKLHTLIQASPPATNTPKKSKINFGWFSKVRTRFFHKAVRALF